MKGAQYQVLLLMKVLRSAGHDCELLARDDGRLWAAAAVADFRVHSASKRALWTQSPRFQLVHAHDADAHTLASLAGRRPIVVSRRVAFPVGKSAAARWKYRQAARYLAVSQFVARELEAAGVSAEAIDVVYDAVDVARGTASWSEQFAAIALPSKDPGKGRDLVEAAAAQSGVLVAYPDDLMAALARASMFIYATRAEALGSAALLAMQMGIPVIASKVGGLAEVFEDGVSGLYVENDPAEIARAMRRILSSAALAKNLIENAYRRIDALFTPERLLSATVAAYEKALTA
jgi:glycosyltransferase involved in cell wall biosynthesis